MLEALLWFKEHFMKCNDRAALIKTWLPQQYEGPRSYIDQLVYDRALLLVGTLDESERRAIDLLVNRAGLPHAKNC